MATIKNLSVKDVVETDTSFNLICLDESDSVADVIVTLGKNRIISAPAKNEHNQLSGIIDMLDLITLCVTKFSKVSLLAMESWQQMEEFAQKQVKDVLNISGRNPDLSISYKAPLSELLLKLSQPNAHRVAVYNEVKDVVGLITQSRVVNVLFERREELKSRFTGTQASQIASRPVESINMNQFVIDAFKQIWDKQVTGIAVVDDTGKLVGNISATDLVRTHVKPIGPILHDLYQPLKNFNNIRATTNDKVLMGDLPSYPPITVHPSDTLETVMKTVVDNKVHRVYLVDDSFKPVGVITLGDIIKMFAPQSE